MGRNKQVVVAVLVIFLMALVWGVAACGEGDTSSSTTASSVVSSTAPTSGDTATTASTAAGSTDSTVAKPTKTAELKIGGSIPLSGPPSAAGLAFKQGWELAFDAVNAAGGIVVGDTAYTVTLLVEDSKGTAEGGTTVATKLCMKEGVKFLMGDISDFMVPPLYAVTSKAGALLFESSAINAKDIPGNVGEVSPDRPLLIRSSPASSELDILPANYLVENYPNAKKVALIALSFADFDSYEDVLTTKWAPLGLTICAFERIAVDTVDFVPMITRILESNPDCIDLMRCAIAQFPMIIKTARDQGFTGPIMYGQPTDIMYAKLAGDDTTDVFGTGLFMDAPDLPEATATAIAEGRAKYGDDLVSDSILAYDQAKLLVQMIEKAQSIDPAEVEKTFETLTNPGDLQSIFGPAFAGGLETTGVNHVLVKPWPLARMMNGQGELIGFFTVDVP
jgi:branched-chain amino acid transport system substrate-binding protein